MNEKIKQLCEQAKAYATESTKDFTGDEPVVWMDYYTEKFAQLIVRECIGVVEGGSFLHEQAPTAIFARECSGAIKQHFGVLTGEWV